MKEQHDEMIKEGYEFSRGVWGKHYRKMREGYQITIHQKDGGTVVKEYLMPPTAVVLEPDVFTRFPNSDAVNEALRRLMSSHYNSNSNSDDSILNPTH
ncbi:hypothetical protein [Thiorhodovibrio frisius]|uniref:Uncharacterized protein n=1 Tax=Thiorhodovibrio frisius TaxID=631362 RepID=H8YWA0_9GAMM|nr:hypothetical protein [Thiorhodovibrio frisius]EIC23703.1 hypothetical protein Thi970DRAFT_00202 [Thiorhodovibrio frisius]WPL20092.1 hypothetical protein Thiofri_00148 [Thiorhodovibrio frisius]